MHAIDWALVIVPIAAVLAVAIYTQRFVKSVADFLAGGRCAGRYLLANALGEADAGLANTMSKFEIILVSGFVVTFWEKLSTPILLLVSITGWVVYRLRETRALTMAQFLEARYSRTFRLYMGMLAFVSGILNYGIFPAISARFFIYFLDLPLWFKVGPLELSTFAVIMVSYLSCAVFMVLIGGQATMMVTDCLEGIFSHAIYIVIAISVFYIVSWTQIVEVMEQAPPGYSHIDPFDASEVEDFNIWFVAMAVLMRIYTTRAMQNKQGFNAAARSAHEARMGSVLGEWRGYARGLMLLVLAICALTYMNHPAFAAESVPIKQAISEIEQPYIQKQMTVPIALRYLLPIGIKGLFVSIMIMGLLAGDAGHLHSWGSIFVQDVILPLKKKAMSPRQHMWVLRIAVASVALFAIFFSTVFPQTQYITLWWFLTGTVFTGGAGAAIIGGLYWKRGTTAAAWSAAITGSLLSLIGIVCGSFWPWVKTSAGPTFASAGITLPEKFFFNNQVSAMIAAACAASTYVVVSLLTCRQPFNLDRMLHRGQYAVEADGGRALAGRKWSIQSVLGFDHNFTFRDKLVAGGIFWWSMLLVVVNLLVTIWNFRAWYPKKWVGHDWIMSVWAAPWPIEWWAHYWMVTGIALPCVIAFATLIWFGIGGVRDLRDFFIALRTHKRDALDDGRVVGHQNLEDVASAAQMAAGESPSDGKIAPKPTGA